MTSKKQNYISQSTAKSKYVKEILKTFGMEDSEPMSMPMVIGQKLQKKMSHLR